MEKSSVPPQEPSPESDRHQTTETKLADAKEVFALLVDAVEDYAIFALDPEGIILTWNPGGQRLKGYRPEEVIGTSFTRFYSREDIERKHPQTELKIAAAKGKYEEEGWRIKKDGSRFWANVVITAMYAQPAGAKKILKGFAKVTRDLTVRKQSEEALRESEERYRLMVEGVEDYAIFMLDPRGHVTTWNRGAERNKGYRAEEIIGKHFSTFYGPEDLAQGKPAYELKQAIANGRFEDEGWRVRKDGTEFWANVIITAVYDGKKHLLGFSKVTRDLTERKKAEDSLRAAYSALEMRVEQRTKELLLAKTKAEKAVAARDQFFSMASHELKTPLTSLKLQTQLRKLRVLKGNLSDFDPKKLLELCEGDERQVNRLAFLVDNMLDVSKLTSGTFDLFYSNTNLTTLIDGVLKIMAPNLIDAGCAWFVSCPSSIHGELDYSRMEQVFTNLLTNCGKYASGKPIEITVTEELGTICIKIKDLGPGIPASEHVRLFSPFERLTHSEASGLGLGLFIIKQIVEAHKGEIELTSEMGKGTTFTISLPAKQGETAETCA